MDLQLSGKVALITGGSRGIGRETALLLAGEGVKIAIAARGVPALEQTAAEIKAVGADVLVVSADLDVPHESARAVAETLKAFGRLDILVCNAGGSRGAREFVNSTDDEWSSTYQFNVGHAVAALRAATDALAASGQGVAIFVASISGRAPAARGAQYSAAKAGLIHAAKSLAWELGPRGIRVNAVSPGSTIFPGGGWERTRAEIPQEFSKFEVEDFPASRLSSVREIADAIVFVASPRASGINAADVQVDGGQRRPSIR